MRYVAAYMLAALGGNEKPTVKDIKGILESVGVSVEDEPLNFVVNQLQGKSLNDLLAEGGKKLASFSMGGGGGAAPVSESKETSEAVPAKEAAKPKEEEEKAESDDDMGFGLFD